MQVLIVNPVKVDNPLAYQRQKESEGVKVHFKLSEKEPVPTTLVKKGKCFYEREH